jgi:hypothetical protein
MEYEIKLPQADMLVIIQALGELPLKVAVNVFGKIHAQMQAQDAANAVPLSSLQEKAA